MIETDCIHAAIGIAFAIVFAIIVLMLNLETGLERWARTRGVLQKPEWWHVLGPRQAVIAGLVGVAIVWPLTSYAYRAGYAAAWGFSTSRQWKDVATPAVVIGFAVPYWLVKWWVRRR